MSAVRSSSRSILTLPLHAGERPAGADVDPVAEGQVLAGVLAVEPELVRMVELAGIAVGRTVEDHHRGPGRDVHPGDRRPATARRKSPFTGPSMRSISSTKFGMSRAVPQELLQVRTLTEQLQRRAEQAHGRLLPGGE